MARLHKSKHLHLVDGTRANRADVKSRGNEPDTKQAIGSAPKGLTERERQVWQAVVEDMPPGLLRSVDQFVLTNFCRAVALGDEAAEKLRASSLLVKSPSGMPMQSPYVGMVNRQPTLVKAIGAELGLSPAARTRVSADRSGEDEDPLDHFFR